jgi:hypothetical protein
MKKLKVILLTVVVSIAITGALAAKKAAFCDTAPQYYKNGDSYIPAGELGVNYTCITQVPATCTYWRPNPVMQPTTYQPCKWGCFYPLNF